MKPALRTLAALALALTLAPAARADAVLFDNIGAAPLADMDGFSDNQSVAHTVSFAYGFTAPGSGDYALDSLALAFAAAGETAAALDLYAAGPSGPGTLLESIPVPVADVPTPPPGAGTLAAPVTAASASHPVLHGGGSYFVAVEVTGPPGFDISVYGDAPRTLVEFIDLDALPWQPGPVPVGTGFAVTAAAIPEPSTFALAGAGLAAVVLIKRKRAQA